MKWLREMVSGFTAQQEILASSRELTTELATYPTSVESRLAEVSSRLSQLRSSSELELRRLEAELKEAGKREELSGSLYSMKKSQGSHERLAEQTDPLSPIEFARSQLSNLDLSPESQPGSRLAGAKIAELEV